MLLLILCYCIIYDIMAIMCNIWMTNYVRKKFENFIFHQITILLMMTNKKLLSQQFYEQFLLIDKQ